MKTIEVKIFAFSELNEQAKEKAIEQVREMYYEHNDFARWAIDDCALFEPKHQELEQLFGKDYKFPLIENTRKNIYFDTDRNSYLDCEDAMIVTNDKHFLTWLGIPEDFQDEIQYRIHTPSGRNNSTTIDFYEYPSEFGDVIDDAVEKFDKHVSDCLQRIERDIDYRFTDEAIIEDIEANEYEFLEDGTRY
jgi:hypothetical protein